SSRRSGLLKSERRPKAPSIASRNWAARQLQVIVAVAISLVELESTNVIVVTPLPVRRPLTETGVPAAGTGDGEMIGPAGLALTLYGAVPPTTMSWKVLPVHAVLVVVAGLTANALAGGAAVLPTSLVSNGDEPPGMVRPVASVIANCMLIKHAPLVVAVKLPPLTRTTLFESDTTPGKVAATV